MFRCCLSKFAVDPDHAHSLNDVLRYPQSWWPIALSAADLEAVRRNVTTFAQRLDAAAVGEVIGRVELAVAVRAARR